ncbi:MAG: hypothetical protein AUJ48_01500 [Deltaproteobacteria bacterium CG1_02_45_11]|nr:MAG: hypothetical protein AUJ48_01500 [Deltaproteobacteria bacterium CG1_02_45_11]
MIVFQGFIIVLKIPSASAISFFASSQGFVIIKCFTRILESLPAAGRLIESPTLLEMIQNF